MRFRQSLALMLALAAAPLPTMAGHCRTKKTEFKTPRKMLVQQERAEADGHQPWRSDPKFVAGVGVMRADPSIHPAGEHHFTSRLIKRSEMKAVYLFTAPSRKKSYRVTVRRYRIRMPNSGKMITTVWWTSEVITTDCSGRPDRTKSSALMK